jgi:two-component system, LytTR family, sensor kinase
MPPLLKSRSVWIASFAAWLALAFFVLARDLVMVGPQAPGLQRDELYAFLWTMLLWGAISPFIIALCDGLPLDRARRWRSLAVHTAWALAFCAGDVLLDLVFYTVVRIPHKSLLGEIYDQAFINVFSYAAIAGAGYAVSYARALATNRIRSAELEQRLAEARLEALTRRLQPHFLFNSLNSIAALIRLEDPDKALAALVALGDLLRVVLATDGDARIPLQQEVAWAEHYLKIERLRFENRLTTAVHIDPQLGQALVPALVLQPFVENAVRHGVERHSGATLVSIAARREGEYLALTVCNSGGDPARQQAQRPGFGLGLESTRARLAHLYGADCFALEIATSAGATTARIRIPLAAAA